MDLQCDDLNTAETESLTRNSNYQYITGSENNANAINVYYDSNMDVKDYNQNPNAFQRQNNEKHLYNDNLKRGHEFIIHPSGYSSMMCGQRNTSSKPSSESICLRYLQTEIKYPPNTPGNNDTESSRNKCNISLLKHNVNYENFRDSPNHVNDEFHKRVEEKLYSDKTTYCRPVLNIYNQEFLYKTIEKNAKLQKLVTELVIARRKEKDIEHWNNYINDLRKKHCDDPNAKRAISLQYVSDELRTHNPFEDISTRTSTSQQSSPCQHLLQDFYKPNDIRPSYNDYKTTNKYNPKSSDYKPFKTNPLCFPTSSQGRLIMLERERVKRIANRGYRPLFNTINEENKLEACEGQKTFSHKESYFGSGKNNVVHNSRSTNTTLTCTSTQTEFQLTPLKMVDENLRKSKGCNTYQSVYDTGSCKEVHNKETSSEKLYFIDNNLKKKSLVCIEEKLDNLIHSINNFILEMTSKSSQNKYLDENKLGKRNVNYTRSDSCSMARKEKIVCGFIGSSSRTTENSSSYNFTKIQTIDDNLHKINDILLKGIGKNKLITLKGSSVGETYHPCSVQISVTIPTKEISTEVTRSLSEAGNFKDRNIIIEEIPKREDRRIAIAVNTDPLSILAMLRVSTEETIRRLLSYVPTIDYYSYLSRLQGPPPRVIETQYICNICGAAFEKPSALTDHIQKHELGNTRDCCVCRHVLDLPRRRPGLFKCQYCGQRFTRAYCCELHQEACAKRLGKVHDVPSSLMLLR